METTEPENEVELNADPELEHTTEVLAKQLNGVELNAAATEHYPDSAKGSFGKTAKFILAAPSTTELSDCTESFLLLGFEHLCPERPGATDAPAEGGCKNPKGKTTGFVKNELVS